MHRVGNMVASMGNSEGVVPMGVGIQRAKALAFRLSFDPSATAILTVSAWILWSS
jgi:hypothetical protein